MPHVSLIYGDIEEETQEEIEEQSIPLVEGLHFTVKQPIYVLFIDVAGHDPSVAHRRTRRRLVLTNHHPTNRWRLKCKL